MDTIRNFKKIRWDGQVIDEQMTPEQVFALGTPQKVITVQWEYGGRPVARQSQYGLLSKVLSGRELVVILEGLDASDTRNSLFVLNADGSLRVSVPNDQTINGTTERGEFRWLEAPRKNEANRFGAVFEPAGRNTMFQLDIDGATGKVVGVYPFR
jgi:hypothetical protein